MPTPHPPACRGCPLDKIGLGFARPEGSGSLGILICGEALGQAEARDSLPFRPYAESGAMLERAIKKAGFAREQFVLTNVVNCQPPFNKLEGAPYEHEAIEHCRIHYTSVLSAFRPRVVLGLGAIPLRANTGMVGHHRGISLLRGFVLPHKQEDLVYIGSFHPSYINRGNRELLAVLIRDIQYAVQISRHGFSQDSGTYELYPTVEDANRYLDILRANPDWPIAYDIESVKTKKEGSEEEYSFDTSQIDQIQFSHKAKQAIIFPWSGPFIGIAKAILALPNPKLGWNNYNFDDPVLRLNGAPVLGPRHDLMWMWNKTQPDLPRGLQFAASFLAPEIGAWKHLVHSEPEYYGGCDVDVLQRMFPKLKTSLKDLGIEKSYYDHVVKLHPILEAMNARGLPIDSAAQEDFRRSILDKKHSIVEACQPLVPNSLKKTKLYKTNPKEIREVLKVHPSAVEIHAERKSGPVHFVSTAKGWTKIDKFNPGSHDQVLAYIKHKGHPVPKVIGGKKESTGAKQLERLAKKTKDPLYDMCNEYKQLDKMKDFIWTPGPDGRVHGTSGHGTGSGQLTMSNPNLQQVPSPKGEGETLRERTANDLAITLRRTIASRPGYKLVEIDLSAAHALTLGYEADCPEYMKLARMDIHSFLTAHLLKLEDKDSLLSLSDDELMKRLSEIKTKHRYTRDKKAKPAILGYGFGLGANKLYELYEENFLNRKEAKAVLDMLNQLFPKVADFRQDIKVLAHKQGRLKSKHGYIRWFMDAMQWSRQHNGWVPGSQAEAAMAFFAANDAHGTLKDVLLRLEAHGMLEAYGFILTVHDSLVFECEDYLVDECISNVTREIEQPVPALGGLRFGCEASVGLNWADMEAVYKTPLDKLFNVE